MKTYGERFTVSMTNVTRRKICGDNVEAHIVIDTVADSTSNNADGKGERCDGRNQVVRADDGGNDRGRDDDASDPQSRNN